MTINGDEPIHLETKIAESDDDMVFPEIMMTAAGWIAMLDDGDEHRRRTPKRALVVIGLSALIVGTAIRLHRRTDRPSRRS